MWTDAKTVNVIAGATLSEHAKVAHTALRFFLRTNDELEHDAVDESDDEDNAMDNYKKVGMVQTVPVFFLSAFSVFHFHRCIRTPLSVWSLSS